MANVLHLEPNAIAAAAMRGSLEKHGHRCVTAATTAASWESLYTLARIDLIFVELDLPARDGLDFIRKLRSDCLLKDIPIAVYSGVSAHEAIQRALALNIQRYLIKPYDERIIDEEVAKAVRSAWRDALFEEQRSFCAQMGLTPAQLLQLREDLVPAADLAAGELAAIFAAKVPAAAGSLLAPLEERAIGAGVWAVANLLQDLRSAAEAGHWSGWDQAAARMGLARRLTHGHLHPEFLEPGFFSAEELQEQAAAKERGVWLEAARQAGPPFADDVQTRIQLDRLQTCPTIDSVVASFEMTATGTVESLGPLMDLVSTDAGLAVEMIMAANRIERTDPTAVDDPRAAVGLLGETRLHAAARIAAAVPARRLNFGPLNWERYSAFQAGVGQMAGFVCRAMELNEIALPATTAGLIHDFGKLLMLQVYPFAWEAAVLLGQRHHLTLGEAERRLVGCTSREMAQYFAEKNRLPSAFLNVVRWIDAPAQAGDDSALVAAVSLARQLCRLHQVGESGEPPGSPAALHLEHSAGWEVLKQRIFPGFDLGRFEASARCFCRRLKEGVCEPVPA